MSIHATQDIPQNETIVSCPFSLAVTPELAKGALKTLSGLSNKKLETLTERQLICTYLVMHWILDEVKDEKFLAGVTDFVHLPYLRTLPSAHVLRTSLHFTERELSLLKGTNLYNATVDRHSEWDAEWRRCKDFVRSMNVDWGAQFTWERYLTLSTYVSSRAFPSTLLSNTPSLISTPSSYPVLLPGLDCLNHSRAHQVSWVVEPKALPAALSSEPSLQVSLIVHTPTHANTEVFNNYGPKPNSELILGYGFSLPANPDDTILLQIGGQGDIARPRWDVGRNARGSEGLWKEIQCIVSDGDEGDIKPWEVDLEAGETFREMIEGKLARIPELPTYAPEEVRTDVWEMVQNYVTGQEDIMLSLLTFADVKRESALIKARENGVELVFEDGVKGDDAE